MLQNSQIAPENSSLESGESSFSKEISQLETCCEKISRKGLSLLPDDFITTPSILGCINANNVLLVLSENVSSIRHLRYEKRYENG